MSLMRGTYRTPTAALLSLLFLLAAGCSSEAAYTSGIVRTSALQVGEMSLPDVTDPDRIAGGIVSDGEIVFRAAPGRLLLVYFGFTHCPDVCPATLADLRVALRDIDGADRVDLVFVTVDPDRDTPEILNEYLPYFLDRFHVSSASEERLRPVADAFLVRYDVSRDSEGEVVEVAHTAVLYAVDEHGDVAVEWPFGTRAAELASDIELLLGSR